MADGTPAKLAHLRAPITELDFSEEEIRRYSRHIVLPEVGGIGQKRINRAVGIGGGRRGLGLSRGVLFGGSRRGQNRHCR